MLKKDTCDRFIYAGRLPTKHVFVNDQKNTNQRSRLLPYFYKEKSEKKQLCERRFQRNIYFFQMIKIIELPYLRRVSSMIEQSSINPKVSGSILTQGPGLWGGFVLLDWSTTSQ